MLSPDTLIPSKEIINRLLTATHTKFGKDMGEVIRDGLLGDVEAGANLTVAYAMGDKGKDFQFLGG